FSKAPASLFPAGRIGPPATLSRHLRIDELRRNFRVEILFIFSAVPVRGERFRVYWLLPGGLVKAVWQGCICLARWPERLTGRPDLPTCRASLLQELENRLR